MSAQKAQSGTGAAGDVLQVRIEKPVYGGAFLARHEGKAVFVSLTLPGEEARVRIVEDKRGYATAEVEEILTVAHERIAPRCKHFGVCGGCHYQHTSHAQQLQIKKTILRETLERGGIAAPERIDVLAGEPWAYRNRIRLAFDAAGRMGYRARRSHAVIPLEECPIAAPLLLEAAFAAKDVLRKILPPLRPTEIALFTNAEESALLVSLIVRAAKEPRIEAFAQALAERISALQGVELVVEAAPQGRRPAPPPRIAARWGENSLRYRAAGFDYRVDNGAFFQVNRGLVDRLVEHVLGDAKGKLAWDLFCGVGLFSRPLAERFERVTAVEIAPSSTAALLENLRGTGGEAVRATTAEFLRRVPASVRPDFVVVDPPRAGLGAEVAEALVRVSTPRMAYVSCDPATLARDLKILIAGGYIVEQVAMADLFPCTFHLETVVHLRRA